MEDKHRRITRIRDLPANARSYLERMQPSWVPITIISTVRIGIKPFIRRNPSAKGSAMAFESVSSQPRPMPRGDDRSPTRPT